MQAATLIAFSLGVIAYSTASTLYFLFLVRGSSAPVQKAAARAVFAGAIFHGAHVFAGSVFSHICPVASIHFGLSLTALVLALGFLLLRRGRAIDALGIFVAPLALMFLVAAQFVSVPRGTSGVSAVLLTFHIAANLCGLGFLLLAGSTAALYLFAERRLKQKKLGLAGRFPPLEALDALGYRLLLGGFPFLTVGAVTGALFLGRLDALSGIAFARAILGYAAWGVVLGVVLTRALLGFRGRRMAYGTLLGVLGLLLVLSVYLIRPWAGMGS